MYNVQNLCITEWLKLPCNIFIWNIYWNWLTHKPITILDVRRWRERREKSNGQVSALIVGE